VFALAVAVGLLGAWFHSGGRPGRIVAGVATAWSLPPGQDGGIRAGSTPPLLAPLAFCGLGILGLLACAYDDRRETAGEYPAHSRRQEAREPH
jgi:hypothetical protein